MKIIIELEITDCKQCPYYHYEGTSWSEDVYTCKKCDREVDGNDIPSFCPYIKSTLEKLQK